MKILLGSDHAGYELRRHLADRALSWGHEAAEVGAASSEPYDYPDASDLVAVKVLAGECDLAVLVCGTGIGVSIRANRYRGVRAAVCCSVKAAELARLHNHANVCCLGARLTDPGDAVEILRAFLKSQEDHDERHERRVQKLDGDVGLSPGVNKGS